MLQALAVAALLSLGAVSTTTTTVSYSGNSSTTAFVTGFKFISSSDLVVTKTTGGVATTLTLGVDYTVTGADSDSGGTVTCTSAPATGSTLTIRRATPVTQAMTLQHQGALPIASMQDAFDKAIMVSQESNSASTTLTSRVGTLETEIAQLDGGLNTLSTHVGVIDGEISSLQSTDTTQNGRLYTLEGDVSTLLTASGFDLGAIYASGHTWTATQTFGDEYVTGTLTADKNGSNSGTLTDGLVFGQVGSGEGISSKRTSGGNQFGLDIWTGGTLRLSITNGGVLSFPGATLGATTFNGVGTFNSGISVSTSGNSTAISGTGHGLGSGGLFVGGSGGGVGLTVLGGAGNAGMIVTGGAGGDGALFTGGFPDGRGLLANGSGSGAGVEIDANGLLITSGGAAISDGVRINSGDIVIATTNPASTTGKSNSLTAANIIKAWANITRGASPAVNGGFNVASVSCASNQITVTFATALANANYATSAVSVGAFASMWIAQQTTSTVKLAALDSAGSALDLCTTTNVVDVTVVGLQ